MLLKDDLNVLWANQQSFLREEVVLFMRKLQTSVSSQNESVYKVLHEVQR